MNPSHEGKKEWYKKWENYLIIFGFVIVIGAVFTPFLIIKLNEYKYNLKTFAGLGTVGDFFGGTTVGLLSLASLMFVTAAMFMQKEELKLQRGEVTATRKEYEITNRTMKKQSFDSTFFNMITLHHNILNEITFKNGKGRHAIELMFKEFSKYYRCDNVHDWCNFFFSEICYENEDIKKFFDKQRDYLKENKVMIDNFDLTQNDIAALDKCQKEIVETKITLRKNLFNINSNFNGRLLENMVNWEMTDYREMMRKRVKEPTENLIKYNYSRFYSKEENSIGHYYRNLYRIVKLIQEYEFSIDSSINQLEKKNYRGILRAQLSSYELLMLFYNISYSEKGKKFQKMLLQSDFFEDHIVFDKLIWKSNDDIELKKYRS